MKVKKFFRALRGRMPVTHTTCTFASGRTTQEILPTGLIYITPSSGIANVPTSGDLIAARGHFLSENSVPDTVQFQQGFLSPQ